MRGTHVEADAPVQGWELDDFAAQHGITPRAGDAVLVRSGSEAFWATQPTDHMPPRPGVGVSTLEFLHKTDAALLGWDLMESAGQGLDNPTPVHRIAIPYMGLPRFAWPKVIAIRTLRHGADLALSSVDPAR